MSHRKVSTTLYPSPFSKAYWKDAALELTNTRVLVFAALMIAMRCALKFVSIPLAPNLKIGVGFLVNALGAMVYGPVVAAICGGITDVLGFIMKPDGIYFIPFILTEMAGGFVFALFFYRSRITPTRVILSRFCICLFVNILLQTPIMMWYYELYMGGKVYSLTTMGILKNLFMFPIESLVLTFFLSMLLPITNRLGLTYTGSDVKEAMKFTKKQIVLLVVLFAVGVGAVGTYLPYYYNNTSLSASYEKDERIERNKAMQAMVMTEDDALSEETTFTVVESAKKKFLGKNITYEVAVYEGSENAVATADTIWAMSKSKAAACEYLTKLYTATVVAAEKDDTVISVTIHR